MKCRYPGVPESTMEYGGAKAGARFMRIASISPVLLAVLLLASCGGGGGGGAAPEQRLPLKTLRWSGPTQFVDNTAIPPESPANPHKFWIYVKTDNTSFSVMDPYYEVPDVNWNNDPNYVYSFALNTPLFVGMLNLKTGTDYYIKMRVVVEGNPSAFSESSRRFRFDE